jgi:pimeloyl-ACP methyl ester carboxylesterase
MTRVVMVHGAFCGGWAFERFREPFEAAGYSVTAVDLRGHGADEPHDRVSGLTMADYAADIARTCETQPEPPVLVGHSLGGLVGQLAARRARFKGLVLLAPSPPWGVAASSVEEAITAMGVQMLSSLAWAVPPDRDVMRRHSLDRVPRAEQEAILARMRPESALALRQTLNWWLDPFMTTSLGPGPLPGPILTLIGERDSVHPPETVTATAERIGSRLEVLAGMSHWLVGEPGWEGVADETLAWLTSLRVGV